MERFTQPGFDPCANCGERSHCEHITDPDFTILCGQAEMYKRLAAYEDMGLEPWDILSATDMAKVACALHELNKYKELGDLDRLRELVEADRKQEFQRHLKRFDIMPPKKISKKDSRMELTDFNTCDLVEELKKRKGVDVHVVENRSDMFVMAEGPAVVLVVTD